MQTEITYYFRPAVILLIYLTIYFRGKQQLLLLFISVVFCYFRETGEEGKKSRLNVERRTAGTKESHRPNSSKSLPLVHLRQSLTTGSRPYSTGYSLVKINANNIYENN